ncbi:MAG: ribonuclease HIII [Bacilli bacterium]|nr:ribonuclease HIII [Bacilli bacterium]
MTISFKISDNTKEKMIEHYKYMTRPKTPAYAIFQADDADTVITLYESGKVVFQGISADIDANIWRETEIMLNGKAPEEKEKKEKKEDNDKTDYYFINSIGSDEVGTGDYFGPIVVCASYVNKKDISFLEDLGVRDSKKITDEKILKIAPDIMKKIPYSAYILKNTEYNTLQEKGYNMNKIKAVLHNKVLLSLMKKDNYITDMVVIDQFTSPRSYFNFIKGEDNVFRKITFTTKAEDKCLSVACSSIISRYIFLKECEEMGNKLGSFVPKGASVMVDDYGKKIVNKFGRDILREVAKLNFKNTEKILNN